MIKRLTIDRGNTALKAAMWSDGGHPDKVVSLPAHAHIGEALEILGVDGPDAVAYSSVVKAARVSDLEAVTQLGCRVYDIKSAGVRLPFVNGYGTPETLGADRIAALAGAMELTGGGALVADLGTAATFDFLEATAEGMVYRGGNIAPGAPLRLRSLHEHTSALPDVSADLVPDGDIWGRSTVSALINGAVCGMLAELDFYRARVPAGTAVVLTGGGAEYLVNHNLISFKHIYDPHLVLRGLNSIITYNEN